FVPMTGAAEDSREVKPDPANPRIVNGSFEGAVGDDPPKPRGWHYQRQAQLVEASDAPDGKHYRVCTNTDPGREAQALQAFAADGRQVRSLEVSFWVNGNQIVPGTARDQRPALWIIFYDTDRRTVDTRPIGGWRGTFGWQQVASTIRVPTAA